MVLRLYSFVILLLCLTATYPVQAEQLPKHLAAFGSDLNRKLATQINTYSGSKEEKAALEEAKRLLKKAGVPQWSAQNIRIDKGAEALAEPLGLDLSDAKQWAKLNSIITKSDSDQRNKLIDTLTANAKANTKETNEEKKQQTAVNDKRSNFDRTQTTLLENFSRRYGVKIGAYGKLQLTWNPDGQTIRMTINGRIKEDDPKSEFMVTMLGHVTPELMAKGNHIRFVVSADKPGLSILPPEQLQEIRASIFGQWVTGNELWVISKRTGTVTREEMRNEDRNQAANDASNAKEEIQKIKQNKVYTWKNKDGEIIRQKKFKKLDDSYHYEGEAYADSNAEKRIVELEKKAAQAARQQQTKPVDQTDPLGRRYNPTDDEAQPLNIGVTYENGYSFEYRTSAFDGQRITADRTLYERSDITDLPMDVIDALIASWSPPEWIELSVVPDPETGEITLEGVRWRMHVTYSYGAFGMGPLKIKSIHTPYTKPLILTRKGMKTAPGAEETLDW